MSVLTRLKTQAYRILIVDDEPELRIFVSTVVETIGFEPIEAQNGSQAIEKARLSDPDLVILDKRVGAVGADDAPVLQQVATIGGSQTLLCVLLHK